LIEKLEDRLLLATWSGDIFDPAPGVPLWTNSEVQQITGNVHIPAGKTLTVEPGTVVQFNAGTNLTIDGTLSATGSSDQAIFFTSYRDHSPVGGIDSAGAGDWGALTFNAGSDASDLDHVVVRYGGGGFIAGEVIVAADIAIANSTFSNTPFLSSGVHINASNPTLTDVTFQSHYAAASMDLASSPIIEGVSASGNTINGMRIDGGSLTSDVNWNSPDMVYVVNGTVTVPEGRMLTLGAGQVVKLTNLFSFAAASISVDGTVKGQGTAAQPVVLTSFSDDTAGGDTNNNGESNVPGGGDWAGIQFNATSTANLLDHVEVRYGGSPGAILVDRAPLTLTNSIVRNTSFFGAGVRIVSADPVINGVTFKDNGAAAVSADLVAHPTIRNVTLSNNLFNGMLLDVGSLPANTTWDNTDIVYVPQPGTMTVPAGITLTIAPGVIVKPNINVNQTNQFRVEGTLKAQGTAEEPIIFTALPDACESSSACRDSFAPADRGR
jgi:hypothetical protein